MENKRTLISERKPFKNAYFSILWSTVFLLAGNIYGLWFWPQDYHMRGVFSKIIACFFILGILVAFNAYQTKKRFKAILFISAGLLLILQCLITISATPQSIDIFANLLQIFPPVFLALFSLKTLEKKSYLLLLKILVSAVFIAHGLLSIGIYEVPEQYVWMIQSVLDTSDLETIRYLKILGLIDILMAVALFVNRFTMPIAIYMTFWGFSTAMAGLIMHIDDSSLWITLHRWGSEFIVKLPNAGFSLTVFYIYKWKSKYVDQ